MTKLKPCPFCGSKAKMERTPINPYYYVICTNLECDATVGRFQPTEEEAVAVWNRRDGEEKWKKNNALVMIVTPPVITGTVNTAVHIVVGSMETLNLTVRIVTRWIFERTVNIL